MNSTSGCFSAQDSRHACTMMNQSEQPEFDWRDPGYLAYAAVMFAIFTCGFFGNALTVFVLSHSAHRCNVLTPLMINLAVAGIFISVFGYPMSFFGAVTGRNLKEGQAQCAWYGFVNGTVGIASIATFTEMSVVMNYCMHQMNTKFRFTAKQTTYLIAGAWLYGLVTMLPPLLGWTRFVPGAAGISCGPDWTDTSMSGVAYTLMLVVVGFFVPLTAIAVSHFRIYRLLRQDFLPGNIHVKLRRRKWQIRLARLTAVAITAFMLSWSPYCFVSIAGIIKGSHVLSPGEAEIPELMAKASIVYNPFVYTAMNRHFRETLWTILSCGRCKSMRCLSGSRGQESRESTSNSPIYVVTEVVSVV